MMPQQNIKVFLDGFAAKKVFLMFFDVKVMMRV